MLLNTREKEMETVQYKQYFFILLGRICIKNLKVFKILLEQIRLYYMAKGWCRQTKRCSIERWHLKLSTSILYQTIKIDYTPKLLQILWFQIQFWVFEKISEWMKTQGSVQI